MSPRQLHASTAKSIYSGPLPRRIPNLQGHGMEQMLSLDLLCNASLESMVRLATWLNVMPSGPWDTVDDQRYDVRAAIVRAEQRLAEGPRDLRWIRQLPAGSTKGPALWPEQWLFGGPPS